jgi:urocanate reductase
MATSHLFPFTFLSMRGHAFLKFFQIPTSIGVMMQTISSPISRKSFVRLAGLTTGIAILGNVQSAFGSSAIYSPGTYSATGKGIGGDVPVTVEFSEDSILSVEIGSNSETQGIGSKAIEQLPDEIVDAQSTDVETVSGATVTSKAIISAVEDCISQAKGEDQELATVSFTPGEYTTTTTGMLGSFKVTANFSQDALENITAGENSETLMVGSKALELLSNRMVEGQTLNLDSITGASVSSAAILSAAEDLVEQAGGNVKAFSQNEVEIETYDDLPHEADVIVVGGGLAGSCFAISAAQNGLDVIVLEALQFTAGNSSLSTGLFLLGNTDIQKSNGIEQSTEEFVEYVLEASDYKKDPERVQLIADNSQELIDWFGSFGVTFSDKLTSGMHGISPSMGDALQAMNEKMVSLGVSIRYATKATDLIIDDSGAVTGVMAKDYYGNETKYSGKAVVLASGGYGNNPDLIAQSWGEEYRGLVYGGLRGMDGTMLIAAMNAGAATRDMDWPHIDACLEVNKGVTITTTLLSAGGGIIIRTDGKRFVEETANHSEVASAKMHELGDPYFYEIYCENSKNASPSLEHKFETYAKMGLPGIYDSVEEMAEAIDVDADTLKETIGSYNAAVRGEQPDEFGRETFYEELVAPFYVIKVSNGVACTTGGLDVDIDDHVLREDGSIIKNLYAIGETASGALIGYIGGESLANSSISGMILGRQLSEELLSK